MVKWYHKGLWSLYSRFESWSASRSAAGPTPGEPRRWSTRRAPEPGSDRSRALPRKTPYMSAQPQETPEPAAARPDVVVAVLAAGHGSRMRSATPKHLHRV